MLEFLAQKNNSLRAFDEPEMLKQGFTFAFEEDRQRILTSAAFRRLAGKTQVINNTTEGDHYRNRLTHSLEVSCVAKKISLLLGLNCTLSEVVALAHDLGHSAFGHTGEDVLNGIMSKVGANFSHNCQTFKILTHLSHLSVQFKGLNLLTESLDGILKHNGPILDATKYQYVLFYNNLVPQNCIINLNTRCSLEGQVAAIADDIAYVSHDIEDGFKAGFFTLEELSNCDKLVATMIAQIAYGYKDYELDRLMSAFKKQMINLLIEDCVQETVSKVKKNGIQTAEEVKNASEQLCVHSIEVQSMIDKIKDFSRQYIYPKSQNMFRKENIEVILADVFAHCLHHPEILPEAPWRIAYFNCVNDSERYDLICDFVAGMTDHYVVAMYKEINQFAFL